MVETSQFDAGWARKLHSLLTLGHQLTILLGAAFGIALVLASSNTIRLQILARRNEIEVSKLIGATDGYPPAVHVFCRIGRAGRTGGLGIERLADCHRQPGCGPELAALQQPSATLRQLAPEEVATALLLGVAHPWSHWAPAWQYRPCTA